MNAVLLERKKNAKGERLVDILVDGTVFHAGIAKPNGLYAERIKTAENIVVAVNSYAELRTEVETLKAQVKALLDAVPSAKVTK